MKYRKDFVTNSSSSSYICEICGNVEESYDGMYECGMAECVNGHVICEEHKLDWTPDLTPEEMKVALLKSDIYYDQDELDMMDEDELAQEYLHNIADPDSDEYTISHLECPICQFIEYTESDLAAYLEKQYGIGRDVVFAHVKRDCPERKSLYDLEYIVHVCKKLDLTPSQVVAGWRHEFTNYREFAALKKS